MGISVIGEMSWDTQILILLCMNGALEYWAECRPQALTKASRHWAIRFYLDEHRTLRDRALFGLAIDSKLGGCDLAKLKIGDVTSGGDIRNPSTVIQQKTGRPVQFEAMSEA